jgi:diguanylate cyclase (GGDEF)-like protein
MHSDSDRHSEPKPPPSLKSSSDFVKRYVGILALVSVILIVGIFWGFNTRNTTLIRHQLEHEARAFFAEIVQTRHWIIKQEGVYVKKKQGMRVDPLLGKIKGLKTSISDLEGNSYLLRNHANITSLNPINPLSEPDPFETKALQQFEEGVEEVSEFAKTPSGVLFRYMAPLVTEEECLLCHGEQGYDIGDIRGGISISIPATHITKEIVETRIYTIISAVALLAVLLSIIIFISHHFIRDLERSEKKLVELATTDGLTGLLNRREGIRRFEQEISHSIRERLPLSVIIIDIDLFKRINDNFGHQTGDIAIVTVGELLVSTLRNYDIICRYGGEEYLIVLPTTELKKAIETAERLRKVVEESTITADDESRVDLTISLGVSSLKPGDSMDGLVYRADNALYIAKQEGRNQVQFID